MGFNLAFKGLNPDGVIRSSKEKIKNFNYDSCQADANMTGLTVIIQSFLISLISLLEYKFPLYH